MADAAELLAERFWDIRMRADPLWASMLGDHRFDELLPDVSEDGQARVAAQLRALLDDAAQVDVGGLRTGERISLEVLREEARGDLEAAQSPLMEFAVAPAMVGPHAWLLETCPKITLPEPAHAEALLARYDRVDRFLTQAADRLRAGVSRGRTPPARAVHQVIGQIDEYLASPLDDDPFLEPAAPAAWDSQRTASWRERVWTAVAQAVRPAMQRYRDCLAEEILASARPEERSGLAWLADGEQLYARAIRRYTSLDLAPDEVHRSGREAIAALDEEYRALAGPVLGTTDLGQIFARLREDPALRFATSAQVRDHAEQALERAHERVGAWFARLPAAGCIVEQMAAHEVRSGTIAYYQPPAPDGTRPGIYRVNTYAPQTRTRFESEALAFHESVPGHHLQIAIAQELDDLPAFRRHGSINAYVEGWALYTERLADEMGLYSGDVERLGMLSFDSWRAGRLVVDTGLHHLGWSREQAVAYLRDNSPLALNNIDNEVDRYISWPGQALGYKIGQREILRLRERAQATLGAAFDIREFHDVVLRHGALPLTVLADVVQYWIHEAGR